MATATQPAHKKELDPRLRSSTSLHFEDALREKIVGQNEAVQALVELHQVFCAGMHSPGRPVRESAVPWADRIGKDAHCRSSSGDSVRRYPRE